MSLSSSSSSVAGSSHSRHHQHEEEHGREQQHRSAGEASVNNRRVWPWGVIVLGSIVAFILTVAMVVEMSSSQVSLGPYDTVRQEEEEKGARLSYTGRRATEGYGSSQSVQSLLAMLEQLREKVRRDSLNPKDRNKFLTVIARTQTLIRDKAVNEQAEKRSNSPQEQETEDRETVQTCYIQRDESEICVYSNLCFDGENLVALMDDQETRQRRDSPQAVPIGSSHPEDCFDPRFQEPSCTEYSQCSFHAKHYRPYPLPYEARDPTIDHPLLFGYRLMGPNGGGYKWLKAHPDIILGDTHSNSVACKAPLKSRGADSKSSIIDERSPGCGGKSSVSAEWLDGPVWWVHLDKGALSNEFQFSSKVLPLYDAMRSNRTRKGTRAPNPYQVKLSKGSYLWPAYENSTQRDLFKRMFTAERFDSAEEPEYEADKRYRYSNAEKKRLLSEARRKAQSNREEQEQADMIKSRYQGQRMVQYTDDHTTDPQYQLNSRYGQVVMGTQWSMPAQAYVAITGPGTTDVSRLVRNKTDIPSFNEGILRLSTQDDSKYLFPADFSRYSSARLLCSRTAVVTGKKNALFTGRADAWMFREYAYKFARSNRMSHPHHPPRRITLLLGRRSQRKIHNIEEVKTKAKSFGLPLSVVEDTQAGFKGRIQQMAETGILIAPHGSPLTNLMFLPQHAVVIELFPYMLRSTLYARLSQLFNLFYIPVSAVSKPPYNPQFTDVDHNLLYNEPFVSECEGLNRSALDTSTVSSCARAIPNYNVNVPLDKLDDALNQAVDLGASFSMDHEEWREIAKTKHGLTPPSYGVPGKHERAISSSSRLKQLGKLWIRDPTADGRE
eukprot:gb/GECG01004655.1/.p1 GENE.gb/GECG01004655.1/~~gb/GECG01004655.1/.p1  ORF type:complete len:836 (+),score=89.44 gb/GECG01004655.1/:1-2508(+)